MATFHYSGKEFRGGKAVEGSLEANTRELARAELGRRGIHAQKLEEVVVARPVAAVIAPPRPKVDPRPLRWRRPLGLLVLLGAVLAGFWFYDPGPRTVAFYPLALRVPDQCGWKYADGALIRWWTLVSKEPLDKVAEVYQGQLGGNRGWSGGYSPVDKSGSWTRGEVLVDRATFQVFPVDPRKPAAVVWVYPGNGLTYVRVAECRPTWLARAPRSQGLPVALQLALKAPNGADKLLLNRMNLAGLPSEVGLLPHLKKLDLSGNQLKGLPDELANLSQLEVLWLDGNPLGSLPPPIVKLKALQSLKLGSCGLTTVPEGIGNLSKLIFLSLDGNSLGVFPPGVLKLTGLKLLIMKDAGLEALPETFCKSLPSLAFIDLRRNKLTRLPKDLGSLSGLKNILLGGNPLPAEEIEALKQAHPGLIVNLDASPDL